MIMTTIKSASAIIVFFFLFITFYYYYSSLLVEVVGGGKMTARYLWGVGTPVPRLLLCDGNIPYL